MGSPLSSSPVTLDRLSPNWSTVPALHANGPATLAADDLAVIPTDAGPLRLSLWADGVRLRLGPDRRDDYGILAEPPAGRPLTLTDTNGASVLESGDLRLTVEHAPLSFRLERAGELVQRSPTDGHFRRRFRMPPLARLAEGWLVGFDLPSGWPVYGLGEKWGPLDKRGQFIRSCNHDALGVNSEWSYKNTPFAWSPAGWGLFVHTPAPVAHAVGFATWSHRAYGLLVEDPSLDLFLFAGADGGDLIATYTRLTGRAPVPPLWSLGVILSRAYYRDAEAVLDAAAEVRARAMPCDVITLDGRTWQHTETRFAFEWDAARYPDPVAVVDALRAMDFKVCLWEYPLVSVHNRLFETMAAHGWLLTDGRTGLPYRYRFDPEPFGEVLTPLPDSGLVDFTHPDAYAYWRDRHAELFAAGVHMIKPDFGEQVEEPCVAYNGEGGHALHNVYALLYNRCVYEAAERYAPDGAFLFSRAAWTGSQRYPAQWGGDPQADWEGLAASIRGALSWGLSGAPFYATDVGGFYGDDRDPVLYVRWTQAAVFAAHLRLHGLGEREPWSYGPEAERLAIAALRLRYRLIPYLWDTMAKAAATGLPVQRAMALAYPQESEAWRFDTQFLFGDHMLVAPCLRPDGRVDVYLPEGRWRQFPSNTPYEGGRVHRLTLALDQMAVFVPEGRAIPLGPDVETTAALPQGPVVSETWMAG
ncbi:alpha-xylosidase [Rhodothalassium salexigens]|uniref:glycoside hydrolase family 31 protein n=1 Tax=Rhodothalassium salexigens TaxID=1086 RepID=UPI0019143404|nr:alpha-xylosidase [Rhodothalassium salexigens]